MDTSKLKKHILIIDDSKDQQVLLKILLESRGYTTDFTHNGEEALSLLRSMTKMPHVILLDLNMPLMGGLDFRQIQRNDPALMDIPVVFMTGEEGQAFAIASSCTEVIRKPLTIWSLMDAVERNTRHH